MLVWCCSWTGESLYVRSPLTMGVMPSTQVWQARCKPLGNLVAVKHVNLEALQEKSLDTLIREAQTMAGLQHEHVLPLHCSFIANEDLWLVMPYISGGNLSQILRSQACMPPFVGSAAKVIKGFCNCFTDTCDKCLSTQEQYTCMVQFMDGMDEELILSIARDILHGLDYLHRHELQHRDLKVWCRFRRHNKSLFRVAHQFAHAAFPADA